MHYMSRLSCDNSHFYGRQKFVYGQLKAHRAHKPFTLRATHRWELMKKKLFFVPQNTFEAAEGTQVFLICKDSNYSADEYFSILDCRGGQFCSF